MLLRSIRKVPSAVAAGATMLALSLIVTGHSRLDGTALQEEPCSIIVSEYCTPGPHEYQGQCEGIDCYSDMEFCCIEMQ